MPKSLKSWTVFPHSPLTQIDDGVLIVTGTMSMPVGRFPRRMTVVGLPQNRTLIWSAIALDEAEMKKIEALGQPEYLVVPGMSHRMDAKIWKMRYPDLHVIAPAGARDAVEKVVPVDATWSDFGDSSVTFESVPGTSEREAALIIHRNGTTLVVNDLISHVRHPYSLGAELAAPLLHYGVKVPEVSRTAKWFCITNPTELAEWFTAQAELPDLRRIVISHGDMIDADPKGALLRLADTLQ